MSPKPARPPVTFSREDVILLRRHAKLCEVWAQTKETRKAAADTYALAKRIEALLPPE